MWENAAPLPENEPPRPPARCAGSEEDLVLWAQILLCLAAIGLVLAAGALDWPVYPELRRAFTAAMQPEQSLLLGEERNLLKFTEQTAGELVDSARSMWEDFTLPATPESARTAHGQPSPPAYARTDSYTPGFPLQFPLPVLPEWRACCGTRYTAGIFPGRDSLFSEKKEGNSGRRVRVRWRTDALR